MKGTEGNHGLQHADRNPETASRGIAENCETDLKELKPKEIELFDGVVAKVYEVSGIEEFRKLQELVSSQLSFSYCLEGRAEWDVDADHCLYFEQGSLMVDSAPLYQAHLTLPTQHLKSVTFTINPKQLTDKTQELFLLFGVDFRLLMDRYYGREDMIFLPDDFGEIHAIFRLFERERIDQSDRLRLKCLELLRTIQDIDPNDIPEPAPCNREQVERIKKVRERMVEDLTHHHTIEELAREFHLSATTLKTVFRRVYGTSINRYLVEYKIDVAEKMLLETELSVTEIALAIGYASTGKFSKTFREQRGITPKKFRDRKR